MNFNLPKDGKKHEMPLGIPRPILLIPQTNLITNLEKIYRNAPKTLIVQINKELIIDEGAINNLITDYVLG